VKHFITMIALAIPLMAATTAGAQPDPYRDGRGHRGDDWRTQDSWNTRDDWSMRGGNLGRLTPGERARIRVAQRRVDRLERRAMADGVITRWERRRIATARMELRQLIYRFRHDVDSGRNRRRDEGVY
jgi:hypothetical protein